MMDNKVNQVFDIGSRDFLWREELNLKAQLVAPKTDENGLTC